MLPGSAYKVYVGVEVEFQPDGKMYPRAVIWEDGRRYEVDKIKSIRPGYAAKAGGQGDQYDIYVNGQLTRLYFERSTNLSGNVIGRWFVERKIPIEV